MMAADVKKVYIMNRLVLMANGQTGNWEQKNARLALSQATAGEGGAAGNRTLVQRR